MLIATALSLLASTVPILQDAQGLDVYHASPVRDGQLLMLEVGPASRCRAPTANHRGTTLPVTPMHGGYHVWVPVALGVHGESLDVTFRCASGKSHKATFPIVRGKYPKRTLSVPKRFSEEPPARAAKESTRIRGSVVKSPGTPAWNGSFLRPVTGKITSPYGQRRVFNGRVKSRHYGVDMDGNRGDPVVAMQDGVVALVARDYFYVGNAVAVDHGGNLFSLYFHLDAVSVVAGEVVTRGKQLGQVGATGRVTGSHLHFAVKVAGIYTDPMAVLRYKPAHRIRPATAPW